MDITNKHNADVVTQLFGAGFKGFLNSNRHTIYTRVRSNSARSVSTMSTATLRKIVTRR